MTERTTLELDVVEYRELHPDLADFSESEARRHYENQGRSEGRNPCALFEPTYYAAQALVDVVDALDHFLSQTRRDVSPHPLFDVEYYRSQAGDVDDPVSHYKNEGWKRGFDPHRLFSTEYYLANPGVRVDRDPLSHYVLAGKTAYDPHPLFATRFYLEQTPGSAAVGSTPLSHYLTTGWEEGLTPHPFFDVEFYLGQLTESGVATDAKHETEPEIGNPLIHYMDAGSAAGLDPHPLFSADYYVMHSSDVHASGTNALSHFAAFGGAELRVHHPLFDPPWYQARTGCTGIPLRHYLQTKGAFDPSPAFKTRWYLANTPSARQSDRTALEHWVTQGARERRPVSSVPLSETALDLMIGGDPTGAGILLRETVGRPVVAGSHPEIVHFTLGAVRSEEHNGLAIGGLPGLLDTDGHLVGAVSPARPVVRIEPSGSVIVRGDRGLASVLPAAPTIPRAVLIDGGFRDDDWDWYLRCLPVLHADEPRSADEVVLVTRELSHPELAMTRHLLADREVVVVDVGDARRVAVARLLQRRAIAADDRRTGQADRRSTLWILDPSDPFDDDARRAILDESLTRDVTVVDASWGPNALDGAIGRSTRLIAASALPMACLLARRGSTIVALDTDSRTGDHLNSVEASGVRVEAIRLPTRGRPAAGERTTLLDPTASFDLITGREP